MRFEVTCSNASNYKLADIQAALSASGALRVNARNAYGWRNQPKVATFAAVSEDAAKTICDAAAIRLGSRFGLPAYKY